VISGSREGGWRGGWGGREEGGGRRVLTCRTRKVRDEHGTWIPPMPANFDQAVKSLDSGQVKLRFNSFFWGLVMCWQKLTNA
jgi:hypothetical protein